MIIKDKETPPIRGTKNIMVSFHFNLFFQLDYSSHKQTRPQIAVNHENNTLSPT